MTRQDEIFSEMRERLHCETDRMFGFLLVGQWLFAILLALALTPFTYEGLERTIHFNVKAAIIFGGAINILPLALIVLRPGWWGTRQTIAVTQMLWSALLIMITGGRIETHFHVFGSLAFLAFYRDWKLLPTATVVVAADHLARGLWWPDSVYGTLDPEWWRFLEHAAWVVFEDVVLVFACVRGVTEMRAAALREATLEGNAAATERVVEERTLDLQASFERYRALVEGTAAIPFELDTSMRLLYVAPQLLELLHCKLHHLEKRDTLVRSFVHPSDAERVRAVLCAFGRGERRSNEPLDFRMVSKTGRTIHIRALLSLVENDRILGVLLDITRQKQLELELRQAQKLESVGRLAAGVAHEINTPIQFVNDSVQFVRDGMTDLISVLHQQQAAVAEAIALSPDRVTPMIGKAAAAVTHADFAYLVEEMPKALERAGDGLDRVATIVRSMKVFAHHSDKMTSVDLNAAVKSTLTIARNEYRYVADLDAQYGDLPQVMCHAGEINQAVLNIVLNAAHAIGDTVPSDGRGRITVRTRVEGDDVVLSIADTGGGIPDDVRERIFDPFFTTKQVGKGTGQGLAIARSVVVDKHKGALTFDSEVGAGTTFYLRIPVNQRIEVQNARLAS